MVNDDIVARLRMSGDLLDRFPKATAKNMFPLSWLREAADEIERLRATLKKAEVVLLEGADLVKDALADRDRWKNWAEEYFYTDPDCECPLCDQVKAAIKNG